MLHSGFDLTKLGLSPADYDILKYQNVTKNVIGTAFGVPTFLLNDLEHSNYANAREQEGVFTRYTVLPKVTKITEAINYRLLPLMGIKKEFRFLTKDLPELKQDAESESRVVATKISCGRMTINEARQLDNAAPVEGGDIPLVPMSMVPLDTVGEEQEPAPVIQPAEATATDTNPNGDVKPDNQQDNQQDNQPKSSSIRTRADIGNQQNNQQNNQLRKPGKEIMSIEMKELIWKSNQIRQKPQVERLTPEVKRLLS